MTKQELTIEEILALAKAKRAESTPSEPDPLHLRHCPYCNILFTPKKATQEFCCTDHQRKSRNKIARYAEDALYHVSPEIAAMEQYFPTVAADVKLTGRIRAGLDTEPEGFRERLATHLQWRCGTPPNDLGIAADLRKAIEAYLSGEPEPPPPEPEYEEEDTFMQMYREFRPQDTEGG